MAFKHVQIPKEILNHLEDSTLKQHQLQTVITDLVTEMTESEMKLLEKMRMVNSMK